MAVDLLSTVLVDVVACRELGYKDCFTRIKLHSVTTVVLWCEGVMRAGNSHISIAPDRFLHFIGQAEIHMYSPKSMRLMLKMFL